MQTTEWRRGNIFFHAFQDTLYVSEVDLERFPDLKPHVRESQACFTKDLLAYLAKFPEDQPLMRSVFEALLRAGTSAYWDEDLSLAKELHPIFEELDEKVIRPWVQAEPANKPVQDSAEAEESEGSPEIIRYNSWNEIFPTQEEADRQFAEFVDDFRSEYSSNNSLASERTEIDPDSQSLV